MYEEAVALTKRIISVTVSFVNIYFNRGSILKAVEAVRLVEMCDQSGSLTKNLLYQLRQDGDDMWLFVAHGKEPYNMHISQCQELRIRIKGTWKATLYNTMNGELEEIEQSVKGDTTELHYRMYDFDSLLVRLELIRSDQIVISSESIRVQDKARGSNPHGFEGHPIAIPSTVPYTLSEPNVLLLVRYIWPMRSTYMYPRRCGEQMEAVGVTNTNSMKLE